MAGVVVDTPATLAQSHFPAMVSSMLVVRLAGHVHYRGTLVPPSAWISASTTPTVYQHGGPVQAVGLVLQPGAAAALFATALGQVNTLRPMAELVGPRWTEVECAVRGAADDGARLEVLCQFVRQTVASPSPCESQLLQGLALLAAMGHRMGLGQRQFERRFVAHWGMAPKQFEVIARINSALGHALAAPGSAVAGAELAADEGGRITPQTLVQVLADRTRRFDKGGEQFYDQISALHKSVRSSNPDGAVYWLARMLDGGCDPSYLARRMTRMAVEDIGLADPQALVICNAAKVAYDFLGSPEGELAIAQAVISSMPTSVSSSTASSERSPLASACTVCASSTPCCTGCACCDSAASNSALDWPAPVNSPNARSSTASSTSLRLKPSPT